MTRKSTKRKTPFLKRNYSITEMSFQCLVSEIIDVGRNSQLTPEAIDLYDDKASSLDMFSLISDMNNGP